MSFTADAAQTTVHGHEFLHAGFLGIVRADRGHDGGEIAELELACERGLVELFSD